MEIKDKVDCLILNLWSCTNYGASLTCWGVQCLAENLGYKAKVINYKPKIGLAYKNTFAEKFANQYLHLTDSVNNYNDFIALNEETDNFIVGSDQVWNAGIMRSHHSGVSENIYLLDFVKNNKKKLSYAASFGKAEFLDNVLNINYKETFKYFINQFDNISVREDDGVRILNQIFDADATQLIDGAFHIPIETLNNMTKNYTNNEKYISCYALPYFSSQKWYQNILTKLSKETGLPIKKMTFNPSVTIEEWLAFIKNAEFVITDSYHAVVFSIIFNRPFVQVKNAQTQSRFESLFRLLEIDNNSIGKDDIVDLDKILAPKNWEKINNILSQERIKAETWLKNAINQPKQLNSQNDFFNYFISKTSMQNELTKKKLYVLANKRKILLKYYKYKILSKILIGKKRNLYKKKKNNYKTLVTLLRNI